jgi:hypothetical protein
MSDDHIEQPKQGASNLRVIASNPRVIRACHTCKHELREGFERSDRYCDASGETIDETIENPDWCGPDLSWWEPKPLELSTAPFRLPLLVRIKRWLVG